MTTTRTCPRCEQPLPSTAKHFYMKSDDKNLDTLCKKCRCAKRQEKKYPTACKNCGDHRRTYSNGNCKNCNETAGLRECTRCREILPREISFNQLASRGDHRYKAVCKTCERTKHLRVKYGLSHGDYEMMLLAQEERCAICGEQAGRDWLNVDHDHETGAIRGLLCRGCNTGLGSFQDRTDLLQAAIDYLRSTQPH